MLGTERKENSRDRIPGEIQTTEVEADIEVKVTEIQRISK